MIAVLPVLSHKFLLPWLLGGPDKVVTRLDISGPNALFGFTTWAFAIFPGQPILLASGLWQALSDWWLTGWLFAAAAAIAGAFKLAGKSQLDSFRRVGSAKSFRKLLAVFGLTFLAGSAVCVFSGQMAYFSGGFGNRILMATWIAQSLLLALVATRLRGRRWRRITAAIVLACACGLIVQEQNSINSWRLQRQVCAAFLASVKQEHMPDWATVMGDVPRRVGGKFLYATVFETPWDWGSMVAMPPSISGDQGAVVGANQPRDMQFERERDYISIGGWWGSDLEEAWLFRFDPNSGGGTLTRIGDGDHFDRLVSEVEAQNRNPRPKVLEEWFAERLFPGQK